MGDTSISKAVLITGCSTGIGRAAAIRFAERGWTTYATARRLESIADLAEKGCKTLQLDVCDEPSRLAAGSAVEAAEGAVGVLVNNAGYSQDGPIEEVPMEQVRAQFETNVFGLTRMTQLVLPGMRKQGWGRVINVSSMGGRMTFPGGGFYHATKHAVEAISDALRFEVRPFGIDVVVIEPGAIRTAFEETSLGTMSSNGESPYGALNDVVTQRVQATYRGNMAAEPEVVGKVIEKAAAARRPRTRYVITAGARMLLMTRRMLPDRAFDALLRTQFRVK